MNIPNKIGFNWSRGFKVLWMITTMTDNEGRRDHNNSHNTSGQATDARESI